MRKLFYSFVAIFLFAQFLTAQTVILKENFESGMPLSWMPLDLDDDGHTWDCHLAPDESPLFAGHESDKCVSSASHIEGIGDLNPDNLLFLPATYLSNGGSLTYWVSAQDADKVADHYTVYASSYLGIDDSGIIFEETLSANPSEQEGKAQGAWVKRTLALPPGTLHVVFRHHKVSGQSWLKLDDIEISTAAVSDEPVALPYFEDFNDTADESLPDKWQAIDNDGDGNNWCVRAIEDHQIKAPRSASWGFGITSPDNWLISPNVSGIKSLSYDISATEIPDCASIIA